MLPTVLVPYTRNADNKCHLNLNFNSNLNSYITSHLTHHPFYHFIISFILFLFFHHPKFQSWYDKHLLNFVIVSVFYMSILFIFYQF